MKSLISAVDISDLLLIVGLTSLIGGIAAIHRPSAAIVFGLICLYLWLRKNQRGKAL